MVKKAKSQNSLIWKTLILHEVKDKTAKNVDVLSFTRNSKLYSHNFGKNKISTGGETSGDHVYFAWNNYKMAPAQRGTGLKRPERV